MRLQRLLSMGSAEIAFRGRQEVFKAMERLVGKTSKLPTRPGFPFRQIPEDGVCGELPEQFLQHGPSRFFAGFELSGIEDEIGGQCIDECREIIQSADAVCQREFPILGYGNLSFGNPVNWNQDPVSGRSAPFIHWTRLNILDADKVGDSKVVWELNRHQWMLDLGQAYCLTGDWRYAEQFEALTRDWMAKNPPGKGINWTSSLEIGMRLISWCWALMLFNRKSALSPDLFAQMVAGIREHARHVERYLSYYFSPNTHLTGEALALFYAGTVFPWFSEAQRWRVLGRQVLLEQLQRQVHPDGVYFEQSTRYQYYTVEIYLHFMILAARNNQGIPAQVPELIMKMLDFLLAVRRPDGTVPQIGDADGGWLLPLVRRGPEDYTGLFATAAALLHRADYAWAAGRVTPEQLWLLGSSGQDSLLPCRPGVTLPRVFRHAGYVVMRNNWQDTAHHLIFDTGHLGCPVSAGHGHADLLSIQCSAFGEPYLVDPGTCCYTADSGWRNYFRSTQAHNTLSVDGCDQAEPAGPFAWKSPRPEARLLSCRIEKHWQLADAVHDAYRHLEDPVIHRRRVAFVNSRYWIVIDDLSGAASHRFCLRYQFAPIPVKTQANGWTRAFGTKGQSLLIRTFADIDLKTDISSGGVDPMRGWVSPGYGRRIPAPMLTCRGKGQLPLCIVTCLIPMADQDAPPPSISTTVKDGSLFMSLALEHGVTDTIRIDGDGFEVNTGRV